MESAINSGNPYFTEQRKTTHADLSTEDCIEQKGHTAGKKVQN